MLVLPNGKLLLAGFSGPEGGNIQVARLNANGALDTTFGTGGKAPVDFGGDDFGARDGAPGQRAHPRGRPVDDRRAPSSRGCGRTARSTRTSTATAA